MHGKGTARARKVSRLWLVTSYVTFHVRMYTANSCMCMCYISLCNITQHYEYLLKLCSEDIKLINSTYQDLRRTYSCTLRSWTGKPEQSSQPQHPRAEPPCISVSVDKVSRKQEYFHIHTAGSSLILKYFVTTCAKRAAGWVDYKNMTYRATLSSTLINWSTEPVASAGCGLS